MARKSKKKFVTKRRWGLPGGHPGKEYPPLKKEMLNYAIGHLGSAARENHNSVTEQIGFIVGFHRTLKELEKKENHPRLKHIRANLTCIMESASELRSLISALDYLSLRELREHGAFRHPSLIVPIDGTRSPGNELIAIAERKGSRLLSLLDAIVGASERALEKLPQKDLGGPFKQQMLGAPANDELSNGCLRLFEEYRPGEAKTTAEGDFRTFVSIVYELSTDKKDVDLDQPVKRSIRSLRQKRHDG